MARYTKTTVSSVSGVNSELDKISNALDDMLDREGATPNQMEVDLDMNSNDILNASTVYTQNLSIDGALVATSEPVATVQTVTTEAATATAGQTLFNLSNEYVAGANTLTVFVNGVKMRLNTDYTETSSSSVTFTSGLSLNDIVEFYIGRYVTDATLYDSDAVTYDPPFTGSTATTVETKLSETVSVKDFGAVGDGVTDDTSAIQAALDMGGRVLVPEGTYYVTSLSVTKDVVLQGDGWNKTFLDFYTTTDNGITWDGDSSLGLNSVGRIEHLAMRYQGSGTPNKSGLYLTRKVNATEVVIDGFSGHGIEFVSVGASTQTPYFCTFTSVRSINNGWSGCRLRDNCNANTFINCQFSSNGIHGFHQELSSLATYNTTMLGGQASYNQQHGYYLANCTNYNFYGIYSEYNNQSATGASAGDTLNGTYKDLYIGDSVTYSSFNLGAFIGNEIGRVRLNTQSSVQVWQGSLPAMGFSAISLGQENVGTGRDFTFEGAASCQHNIVFKETTSPIFKIRYDGSNANPTNELQFVPLDGGVEGTPPIIMRNNGNLGFYGATPISKPSVTGSAGGNAALQSLLTQLESLGIITDSST